MGLPASPLAAYRPFPAGIQNGLYKLKALSGSPCPWSAVEAPPEASPACRRELRPAPGPGLPGLAARPLPWAGLLSARLPQIFEVAGLSARCARVQISAWPPPRVI